MLSKSHAGQPWLASENLLHHRADEAGEGFRRANQQRSAESGQRQGVFAVEVVEECALGDAGLTAQGVDRSRGVAAR